MSDKEKLRESIEEHGVLVPIFIDGDRIIDGHHRYELAQAMGKPVPYVEWPEDFQPELRKLIAKYFRRMFDTLTDSGDENHEV